MKSMTPVNHVVFLQPVANQLTWLEAKSENGRLLAVSAGAQPLREEETEEGNHPLPLSAPAGVRVAIPVLPES